MKTAIMTHIAANVVVKPISYDDQRDESTTERKRQLFDKSREFKKTSIFANFPTVFSLTCKTMLLLPPRHEAS